MSVILKFDTHKEDDLRAEGHDDRGVVARSYGIIPNAGKTRFTILGSDRELQVAALYELEMIEEDTPHNEAMERKWRAHQAVQAMLGGTMTLEAAKVLREHRESMEASGNE